MSTETIRKLNDAFRCHGVGCGRTMVTHSIADLGPAFQLAAHLAVRSFNAFSADNDPHGEHDFGSFDLQGQKCFWKIDYYDHSLKAGSEDPSDPLRTFRVLTIMLAEDY